MRESSGRGERGRDADEESLALLLFGACVSVRSSTTPKKPLDTTPLGSWATGEIPGSSSDDNGDGTSPAGGLAPFVGEVSINRVGLIFPVDDRRTTCRDKGKHAPV